MPRIPKFKTEEEFAKFIEEHDLADYWKELEEVKEVTVALPRPAKKMVALRIYPYLLEKIKKIARQKGVPYQTLIQQWLAEKVGEEKKEAS